MNSSPGNTSPFYSRQLRKFAVTATMTLFISLFLFLYLLPFGNMMTIATRSEDQLSTGANELDSADVGADLHLSGPALIQFTWFPLIREPKEFALFKAGRASSQFVDPSNPNAAPIVSGKRNWRTLTKLQAFDPHLENFPDAWNLANFPLLFRNTLIIAVFGMIGTLLSSICVAYAFARFPLPGKNILFIILIATIILPTQVTLIPTYAFFAAIGWVNTSYR